MEVYTDGAVDELPALGVVASVEPVVAGPPILVGTLEGLRQVIVAEPTVLLSQPPVEAGPSRGLEDYGHLGEVRAVEIEPDQRLFGRS